MSAATTIWRAGRVVAPPAPTPDAEALRRLTAYVESEVQRALEWSDDGLLRAVVEADGGRSSYRYDRHGDLIELVEPDGSARAFCYDARRRLSAATHVGGATTTLRYEGDRLAEVDDRGARTRYRYDATGRLVQVLRGDAGAVEYEYEGECVVAAATGQIANRYHYDAAGRLTALSQSVDGVELTLRMRFDGAGRLAALHIPDVGAVRYAWTATGRLDAVALDATPLATYSYDDRARHTRVRLGNGLASITAADPIDGRPGYWAVQVGAAPVIERRYRYDAARRLVGDGERLYRYDAAQRLVTAESADAAVAYGYDALDNRLGGPACGDDDRGRLAWKMAAGGRMTYLYDSADQLIEARRDGNVVARFIYDHKGRVAVARSGDRVERYLYGAADELVAVADERGCVVRAYVPTPLGVLAVVEQGQIHWLHCDPRGALLGASDDAGRLVAGYAYDAFGLPTAQPGALAPMFSGRVWHAAVGLYRVGARWYDPELGRFITPDSYTAAPDDARLLDPRLSGVQQVALRDQWLLDWLKRPRARNRRAFCGNDPLNTSDPNGHWSFGGVLLSVLGAIWTLPNTLLGIAIEITCLIGEVVRWVVSLVSGGSATWETPGFDVAASGRLDAFALVFSGGWLGSFRNLLGITFGNVFFVYKGWRSSPMFDDPRPVHPSAYGGELELPRDEALYEHELRHTNQYGWFGPFYHLGLPIFGVYEWDIILNGYENAWLERDARAHGGIDAADLVPEIAPEPAPPAPVAPPAPPAPPAPGLAPLPATPLYGGYALRRGDADAQRRYAGVVRQAALGDRLPQPGETPFVEQLQEDLRALGFGIVEQADGRYGRTTEWAVREFQAYARLEHVAMEAGGPGASAAYPDRLSQVAVPAERRYAGPISGVANDATQRLIRHWVASRWRCPVVITAWRMSGGQRSAIVRENLWRHDELESTAPRMFARDLSGAFPLPAAHAADEWFPVGDFQSYLDWSGPRSAPPLHTWPEAEMLPENLVGQPLAQLSAAQLATYKVVRAASEVECRGFFDSLNAYDNAFVSLGPCHWTLAIVNGPNAVDEGELCGFLAYLRDADAAAFELAFGRFGATVDERWTGASGEPSGADLFVASARKYVGWPALQAEDGSYQRVGRGDAQSSLEDELNYFKSWHWFYRLEMAGRTIPGFQRRMWHAARIRLRDIGAAPWPTSAHVPPVALADGATRPATIGDVYASERAMALLLRWHIRLPGHVVSGGHAGARLVAALQRANIPAGAGDPTTWTAAQQAALVQGLLDEVDAIGNDNLSETIGYVNTWPAWANGSNPSGYVLPGTIGRLSTARSFVLDTDDLPPAPYGSGGA